MRSLRRDGDDVALAFALALPDLLAGRITVMMNNLPAQVDPIRSGKLRGLGVTTLKRSPRLPEICLCKLRRVPGASRWPGVERKVLSIVDDSRLLRRDRARNALCADAHGFSLHAGVKQTSICDVKGRRRHNAQTASRGNPQALAR
jgi:hypothetical protein